MLKVYIEYIKQDIVTPVKESGAMFSIAASIFYSYKNIDSFFG